MVFYSAYVLSEKKNKLNVFVFNYVFKKITVIWRLIMCLKNKKKSLMLLSDILRALVS